MAEQVKRSQLLTLCDAMLSLYYGKRWHFDNNDYNNYNSLVWEEDGQRPSEGSLLLELQRLKANLDKQQYINDRKFHYSSAEEWMEAYLQKELDNQPEQWNALVEKRNKIKAQNPKK